MDAADKFFMRSILHGMDEDDLPIDYREQKNLLEKFADPETSDTVAFAIEKVRKEEGKLFSKKAFEKFLHTIRLFIGGRVLGQFEKTKKEPEVLVVKITVEHMSYEEYREFKKST